MLHDLPESNLIFGQSMSGASLSVRGGHFTVAFWAQMCRSERNLGKGEVVVPFWAYGN